MAPQDATFRRKGRERSRDRASRRPGSAAPGKRNGALDGLRGLAVIAVMAYHVIPESFTGGWLGVDIFFVLSGFLICSMLLRERDRTGTIDYKNFLVGRARRLIPGMVMMLLGVLVAAILLESAGRRRSVAIDVISAATQVSNWRLILADESYFAKVSAPSPIRHTWSLGVQEQFYFLFPLVLLFLFVRLRSYQNLAWFFGGLGVVSLGCMVWLYDPGTDPSRVYFGTETRLFELLVGVVGAILLHRRTVLAQRRPRASRPRGWRRATEETFGWLGLGCLGLLVVWMFTVDEFSPWLFLGGLAAIDLMAMIVITAATSPFPNVMTRLLAVRPLMKAGDMSYSLYLWHWPVIVYLAPLMQGAPEIARQVAAVVVTIGLATVSYTYVERPIHRDGLRGLSRRRPRLGPRLAIAAAPAVLVGALALNVSPAVAAADSVDLTLPADPYYGTDAAALPESVAEHDVILVGASSAEGLGRRGKADRTPDVRLQTVASLGCTPVSRETVREGSVVPEPAECASFRREWVETTSKATSPTVVFFLPTSMLSDLKVDGRVVTPGTPEGDEVLTGILDEMRRQAVDNGAAKVAVINLACHERVDFGTDPSVTRSNDIGSVQHLNGVVSTWAERSGTDVYDMYGLLCPGGAYFGEINQKTLYDDGLHFSTQSAPVIWQWLANEVRTHSATPAP